MISLCLSSVRRQLFDFLKFLRHYLYFGKFRAIPVSYGTKMAASSADLSQSTDNDLVPSDNVLHTYSTRDYSLNINKTLRKKINACSEVKVEYELTGGEIMGFMDTATFELFCVACKEFYSHFPSQEGYCELNVSEDNKKESSGPEYLFRKT